MQAAPETQDELSAELQQQGAVAERLTQTLAAERTLHAISPAADSPPLAGLERLPTDAVLGQQWADEVHAAHAAQEAVSQSIADGDREAAKGCSTSFKPWTTGVMLLCCRPCRFILAVTFDRGPVIVAREVGQQYVRYAGLALLLHRYPADIQRTLQATYHAFSSRTCKGPYGGSGGACMGRGSARRGCRT